MIDSGVSKYNSKRNRADTFCLGSLFSTVSGIDETLIS